MEKNKIAKWLFVYFFLVTSVLGFILILLGKQLLHIDDTNGLVAIIIPTFVGQLTLIVKWIVDNSIKQNQNDKYINISPFLVKAPPIVFLIIILLTFTIRIIGFNSDASWTPSDDQIKTVFTFFISIFNATTIYLISIYFSIKK